MENSNVAEIEKRKARAARFEVPLNNPEDKKALRVRPVALKFLTGLPQDRSCSWCMLMDVSSDRFGTVGDAAAEKRMSSEPISSQ